MTAPSLSIFTAVLMILSTVPSLADEALARRAGCLDCHAVEKKVSAPKFKDIAAKYAGDPRARETLHESVKNGSKGKWRDTGGKPMPPHWGLLSDAEIRSLVDWLLSQDGEE